MTHEVIDMTSKTDSKNLTSALEDYLETIQKLVDDKGYARVRDICKVRGVKSGSVSPAVKRLSNMKLINHERGEFITLTAKGETIARRTQARHDLLVRFLQDVLMVERKQAENDACAMEHHLSDSSVDKLTRFFEFIRNCPEGQDDFLKRFHDCPIVNKSKKTCSRSSAGRHKTPPIGKRLNVLKPGECGSVSRIDASDKLRGKLINLGFLPGVEVEMDRNGKQGPLQVILKGHKIKISREESKAVLLQ